MKLGNKILLLMLLITIGTSALLAWVVTLNVTNYETRRAHERIGSAIERYLSRLEDRHRQVRTIVQNLVEAPASRSQLQSLDSGDSAAREQLRQEVFGRTVHQEIKTAQGAPAFHILLNQTGDVLLAVAPEEHGLEEVISAPTIHWPVDETLNTPDQLVSTYVSTEAGLFFAMGVPLRTQLDELPSHAYFVGFRVDDDWARRQLLAERSLQGPSDAPLSAFFVMNQNVVARASSDPADTRVEAFNGQLPARSTSKAPMPASRAIGGAEYVSFINAGETYLGQAFDLKTTAAPSAGRLILASSLDQALAPLYNLQWQIALCAVAACAIAVFACRWLAWRIASPVNELLTGAQKIGEGQFDHPVRVRRRDEFGRLAHAFNSMARGLKERDLLRDERTKIERDLALARKIQQDVLPKHIPPCPGYDLAAYSLPAEQAGGDIYDLVAVALDDQEPGAPPSMILLLADATGHGVGPALSVTQVRAMLRIGVRLRAGLDDVFRQINRQLCQDLGAERFVTAFLGLLNPSEHLVDYQSAGQAPLLHFRARDKHLQWLDSSTIPFGIEENPGGQGAQQVALEPGDLFVLLTDGFYEFQNPAGEQFSSTRVGNVVRDHHHRSSKEILDELLASIRTFGIGAHQHDDMTALIIKRHPTN